MRKLIVSVLALGAFSLAGCVSNYGGEGAVAGGAVGAGVGAVAGGGGNVVTGAAVGAAVGAVAGSQISKKDKGCYRYNRDGERYWDRNC